MGWTLCNSMTAVMAWRKHLHRIDTSYAVLHIIRLGLMSSWCVCSILAGCIGSTCLSRVIVSPRWCHLIIMVDLVLILIYRVESHLIKQFYQGMNKYYLHLSTNPRIRTPKWNYYWPMASTDDAFQHLSPPMDQIHRSLLRLHFLGPYTD